MVAKHLLDSLAMHPCRPRRAGGALADLGTGPGLPGIPLAIAKPGLQVTLVESNGKKARFLREAVRTAGAGQRARGRVARRGAGRAGRLRRDHRPRAGHAAAASSNVGGHLLKPGGRLLAMKGVQPDEEIAALPAGWAVAAVHPLCVPGLAASATWWSSPRGLTRRPTLNRVAATPGRGRSPSA